jgi:hypothetical protein
LPKRAGARTCSRAVSNPIYVLALLDRAIQWPRVRAATRVL